MLLVDISNVTAVRGGIGAAHNKPSQDRNF